MIAPGETIGILGGGQPGRMIALAAAQLGYRCHVFAPEPDAIAADVCARFTNADWHDRDAMAAFAADCAVITYEFENVPVVPVAALAPVPVLPHPRALETAQDRLAEKVFVSGLGGTPAPFAQVDSDADLRAALSRIGTPGILKTRRDGYDGKGQWRIASPEDADRLDLPTVPLIYEGFVTFEAEFSVILCRGADGDIRFWDCAQNIHLGGILSTSTLPAGRHVLDQVEPARALAAKVAETLDYAGVLTIEFFATARGHNSGHLTIESALTSQFENHVRAICGLPLGSTAMACKGAVMENLIGEQAHDWVRILSDPANHLHLYGKAAARPGRKMGHVTRLEL